MSNYLDDLNEVKVILNSGKVVLCPTDTIWGLSCKAFDELAVERIYQLKKRDRNKPFILLVDNISRLKNLVEHIHPRIETLIHYHLRPLSIIYKAKPSLPKFLIPETDTVAIRVTKHPMLQELISLIDAPLISTSANEQGKKTPVNFDDISILMKREVDYVFHTGRDINKHAKSSQLISWDEEGELTFLR